MTATGSHIDFGFAARGTTPRGRLSLRRVLRIEFERAGHAAAPTFVNDTAYRPSSAQIYKSSGRGMPRPYNALPGDI